MIIKVRILVDAIIIVKDVLIHRHGTLIMEKNLQKKTKKGLWKI